MQQGALKYYASAVNARSALAEHGGLLVGWYHLLCLYCAEQVNGGIIQDCKSWTTKQWMFRVGLDGCPKDVPGLFHWDGDDLIVEGYNVEAEEKALSKRRGGKKAAEARWGRREDADNAPSNADCNTISNAKRITECNADCNTFGNTKERKGEERREKEENNPSPFIPPPCTVEEVEAHLRNTVMMGGVRLSPDQIPTCTAAYFSKRDLTDWKRGEIPITRNKWRSDVVNFAISYAENHPLAPGNGGERDPFPDSSNLGKQFS